MATIKSRKPKDVRQYDPADDDTLVEFTKSLPGYYDEDEIRANLDIVKRLPWGASIVELGVQFGRSASIYFQEFRRRILNRERPDEFDLPLRITLVDTWCVDGKDAHPFFDQLAENTGVTGRYVGHWMRSDEAVTLIKGPIDLLHIDADHIDGVWTDCRDYIPKVVPGGWILIHDYQRMGGTSKSGDMFPNVKAAVDHYTKEYGLEDHGIVNTLAVRRKPQ